MSRKYCFVISCLLLLISKIAIASSDEAFRKGDYNSAYRLAFLAYQTENEASINDLLVLGKIYLEGLGASEKDTIKAVKYLSEAVSNGSIDAAIFVAKQYENGENLNKSLVHALKYYKKAQDLGSTGLEQKIASISTVISGGDVSGENCKEILDAAKKRQNDFYILAAKCSAFINNDLANGIKFLRLKFSASGHKDNAVIIDMLLDDGSPLFSPSLAFELVSSIKGQQNKSREELFSKIFNRIDENIKADEFQKSINVLAEMYISSPDAFDYLLKLFESGVKSRDPEVPQIAVNYISKNLADRFRAEDSPRILVSLLSLDGISKSAKIELADLISKNEEFLRSRFSSFEQEERVAIINVLLDGRVRTVSPSFAFELVSSIEGHQNESREELFSKVFSSVDDGMKTEEFQKSIDVLAEAYFEYPEAFDYLVKLFGIGLKSRNPELSQMAIDYISQDAGLELRDQDSVKIITSLLSLEDVTKISKDRLSDLVLAQAKGFVERNKQDNELVLFYARDRANKGLCGPAQMLFETENFYSAIKYAQMIVEANGNCRDGNFQNTRNGFLNFPKTQNHSTINSLKSMCSFQSKNACHALGLMYLNNAGASMSDVDAKVLAKASFERAFFDGDSADSAVELSIMHADNGQTDEALKYAKYAYSNGLLEGLYAESYSQINLLFSSGTKSCEPLNRFLLEATIDNPFYEKTRLLHREKKCEN